MTIIIVLMIIIGGFLVCNIQAVFTKPGLLCIGSIFASAISWNANHSVAWAAIHGILGWMYIAYSVVFIG